MATLVDSNVLLDIATAIVALAQLVAFLSYQLRVVAGLQAIATDRRRAASTRRAARWWIDGGGRITEL